MTHPVESYSYSARMMGTHILLKLFTADETLAVNCFNQIKTLEDLLTVNRERSQIMDVNRAAGRHPVAVSPRVFALIRRAKDASLTPDGCFNFAIGPLVKLWKIGFDGCAVPAAAEIQRRLALTNPQRVILNEREQSVFLTQAGMEIDLGAIAKGYIADEIKAFLHRHGVDNAILNLGGNVQAIGQPPSADGWSVGLQKPFAANGELIGVIRVKNKSVVTSGIYERYMTVGERQYHHILNPATGYPLDNELAGVTLISDASIDGDIYSTLMYGMGAEAGSRYLRDRPGIEAIFVTRDNRVILSSRQGYAFELLDERYSLYAACSGLY